MSGAKAFAYGSTPNGRTAGNWHRRPRHIARGRAAARSQGAAAPRDEGVDVVGLVEQGRAASRRQRHWEERSKQLSAAAPPTPLPLERCHRCLDQSVGVGLAIADKLQVHTPPATCRVHDATKPRLTSGASCVRCRKLVQAGRTLGGVCRTAHDDPPDACRVAALASARVGEARGRPADASGLPGSPWDGVRPKAHGRPSGEGRGALSA
jgi:hypothetical protein